MDLAEAIRQRGSVKEYDPEAAISDEELGEIFELVLRTPSSFNLQYGRFIVVRDQAVKDRIMAAAWGQAHLGSASADVVILGKLRAHEDAEEIWSDAPEEVRSRMVPMIHAFYDANQDLQRDEAIRTGGLLGMTLMLVAQSRGWSTCPMIGFDPVKVAEILGVPEGHVPVMIVTVGKGTAPARPSGRFGAERVVRMDGFDGPALA